MQIGTTDDMIIPLPSGEIAAALAPRYSFLRRPHEADTEHLVYTVEPVLSPGKPGFLVSFARPEMCDHLDAAIAENLSAYELALLGDRWFGRTKTLAVHPVFRRNAGAGFLALCAIAWPGLP